MLRQVAAARLALHQQLVDAWLAEQQLAPQATAPGGLVVQMP